MLMNEQRDCILNDIRLFHSQYSLSCEPHNSLLNVSDDLLYYIISLLKNEAITPPDTSIDDWYRLFSTLNSHWILPLLYWQIAHAPQKFHPPPEIVDYLRIKFLKSKARSLMVDKQIKEILDAFNKNNIRVLVLKGVALARTVYTDSANRSGSDIDLLVLPNCVFRARSIMENLGYYCEETYFNNFKYLYDEEAFSYNDKSKNYLTVEIHWDISPFQLLSSHNTDQFFNRAVEVTWNDFTFEVLDPVDTIIHQVIHLGMRHRSSIRLSWIYDIYLLCSMLKPCDWDVIQERSVEYNSRIALEKCLIMAQLWTPFEIPNDYRDFEKWPHPSKSELRVYSYLSSEQKSILSRFMLKWPTLCTFDRES